MDNKKSKIAILYVCTGKYEIFWKDFFCSYEKYFLSETEKHYYVFTDADRIYAQDECRRIHKIYQKNLGWPDNTLMRFHIFSKYFEELADYDYVFFMNANCQCVSSITEKEFLPIDEDILVVKHPGFYNKTNKEFTYDRNPKSTAYIPKGEGEYYVCGGVNGGKSKSFIKLMKKLMENIDKDKENNVIALWHDESQLNKYISQYNNYKILSPSYCYPEGWDIPFEMKILIRDKSKWIDVSNIKNISFFKRISDKIYQAIRK